MLHKWFLIYRSFLRKRLVKLYQMWYNKTGNIRKGDDMQMRKKRIASPTSGYHIGERSRKRIPGSDKCDKGYAFAEVAQLFEALGNIKAQKDLQKF